MRSRFRSHLHFLLMPLLLWLPLAALAQTPPTLIVAAISPKAPKPAVLIGTPALVIKPLRLAYTGTDIGGTTTLRTVILPAGTPPLGANPLTVTGGTLSNQIVTVLPDGRQQVTFAIAIAGGQGGKAVVSIPAVPALIPATFFHTNFFDFSRPPGARTITSASKGNVFLGATPAACAPVLTFSNADGKVVAYKVISATSGAVAASGTVPAGATSASPALTAFGPYYFYALGAASQGQYGAVLGSTAFGLAPPTPAGVNLPDLPAKSAFTSTAPFYDADAAEAGWMQGGPYRYSIYDAARLSSELPGLIANLRAQKAAYVLGPDGTVADPVRGRPVFVNFVQFSLTDPWKVAVNSDGTPNLVKRAQAMSDADYQAAVTAGVAQAVAALVPEGVLNFEGPNEPAPSPSSLPLLRAFYSAAHSGAAGISVLGPGFVSATGGLDAFLAACQGVYPFDALSFHAYGTVDGDFDLGERQMSLQDSILAKYGLSGIARWQTEQSYGSPLQGVNTPARPVAWLAAQRLILERHRTPLEHDAYWHHKANGDWAYPQWAENPDGSLNGQGFFLRQFATETWAKPFASAYDFGSANALWYGDRFDGQGPELGKSVSVFAGKQTRGEFLTLALSGSSIPASLMTYDTYGNSRAVSVINGRATLPSTSGPILYVPHASSLTLTPVNCDWGPNLALNAPVLTPTNQQFAGRITNGVFENGYDGTARVWGSDAAWMASTDPQGTVGAYVALPYSVIVDLGADRLVSRVLVGGPPPWQSMSSTLSASVYIAKSADVTKVEASAGTVITGSVFSDGSGANGNGPSVAASAFDGNVATLYQSAAATGYVGIDAGMPVSVSLIRFAPHSPFFEGDLVGGVFEGSNTGPTAGYVPLATVTKLPSAGLNTLAVTDHTPYRWLRYRGKSGVHTDIAEVQFVGGVVAQSVSLSKGWSWRADFGQPNPLLEIFNDQNTSATQASDYTPQVARWDVPFAATTARFIRIDFKAVTNGGVGSSLGFQYGGQGARQMVTLGDVQVFGPVQTPAVQPLPIQTSRAFTTRPLLSFQTRRVREAYAK